MTTNFPALVAAYLAARTTYDALPWNTATDEQLHALQDARSAMMAAHPALAEGKPLRLWGDYVLQCRTEYGSAARGNRGRYSGSKAHKLDTEYVVDVLRPEDERPGTIGHRFLRTRTPQLFSARPVCGCTQGQRAGLPSHHLTAADVTCAKCNA